MRETATFKTFNSSHRGIAPSPYQRRNPRILFPDNLDVSGESQSMGKQQNAENYESCHGSNSHDQDFHLHFLGSQRKVIVHFEPFQSPPLFAARLIIQPNG